MNYSLKRLKILYLQHQYKSIKTLVYKTYFSLIINYFLSMVCIVLLVISDSKSSYIVLSVAICINFFTSFKVIESLNNMKELRSVIKNQLDNEVTQNGKSNI